MFGFYPVPEKVCGGDLGPVKQPAVGEMFIKKNYINKKN
jgi:hypothetical protein